MNQSSKMNILDLIGTKFQSKQGQVSLEEVTKYPLIGIFFSADWCPPCQGVVPLLTSFYSEVNAKEMQFEIIFCSSDQDEESFIEHFDSMPWLAFSYGSKQQIELYEEFDIVGVPVLVVINSQGDVLDTKGRNTIQKKGVNSINYWKEQNQALEASN